MKVTCGESTPSVPPEKMVMASFGMMGSQTVCASVREKSLTQPFPGEGVSLFGLAFGVPGCWAYLRSCL
jgi:hypothetical protein